MKSASALTTSKDVILGLALFSWDCYICKTCNSGELGCHWVQLGDQSGQPELYRQIFRDNKRNY